jgi:prophage maintenance system killer protein
MKYVSLDDCCNALFDLAIDFDLHENTPRYEDNKIGTEKLNATLNHVQQDWYPTKLEKAAYIFVSINKGHFFANGNKRLALIVTLFFLYENNFKHKNIQKKEFKKWFSKNFPKHKLSRSKFRTIYGWAFYNLNKAIAASNKKFDELKDSIRDFLTLFLEH